MDPASWRGLAAIHLDRSEDDQALPQLIELARIEQSDPAVPRKDADILFRRGDLREAQYWYHQALFIDPFGTDIHNAMGNACMRSNDYRTALREYEMRRGSIRQALVLRVRSPGRLQLGDRDLAKRHADRAIKSTRPRPSVRSSILLPRHPPIRPKPG